MNLLYYFLKSKITSKGGKMKHLFLLLFCITAVFTVGCSDEQANMPSDILGKRVGGGFVDTTVVFTAQDLNIVSTRTNYGRYNGLWLGNLDSREYGFTLFFNTDTSQSDITFASITLFYDQVYADYVPDVLDFKVDFVSEITDHEGVFSMEGAHSAHRIHTDSVRVERGVGDEVVSYFDSRETIYRAVYMIPEELLGLFERRGQVAISVLYGNMEGLASFYVPGFTPNFQPNPVPYLELTSTTLQETERGSVISSSVRRYRATSHQNYVPRPAVEEVGTHSLGNMDNNRISFTFPPEYDFRYNIRDITLEFVPILVTSTYGFTRDDARFNLGFAASTISSNWNDTLSTANITGWGITALRNGAAISIEPSFNVPFLYDAYIRDIKVTVKKSIYRE